MKAMHDPGLDLGPVVGGKKVNERQYLDNWRDYKTDLESITVLMLIFLVLITVSW